MADTNMPVTLDFYAVFTLLGIAQALFLSLFFLGSDNRGKPFNIFQGWMLVCMALSLLEIFLLYTGYIANVLFLVDFSEAISLLIAPLFYLSVKSLLKGRIKKVEIAVHFALPVLYFLSSLPYLFSSEAIKFNAWVTAYDLDYPMQAINEPWWWDSPFFRLTFWHTDILVAGFSVYFVMAAWLLVSAFRHRNERLLAPKTQALKTARASAIQFFVLLLIIIVVKLMNPRDTGDQIIAACISLSIYFTSFIVVKNSGFFKQVPLTDDGKYKNSNLSADDKVRIADLLSRLMEEGKLFTSGDISLAKLAAEIRSTPHVVSQVINEKFDKSFFEWIGEYRIAESKVLLKQHPNYKIEEIADRVGYSSKSSFNTAFKKITGMTPSQYRQSE
ncbi:helix-turn-helix domain-containing protein [Parapedobacter koreensis]|uniref:Transcriptional regulator, AraC family n=1 Tax=Parapedobacter koreensis TaxID=332977 RepID=A0A1H7P359_9SPHI|nr:helix-turn-helix transcriptional regulator [Parapedobacter koreensis]SEL30029.1 transcriptional regulator, AraC family [Parapedobacter koreensis]